MKNSFKFVSVCGLLASVVLLSSCASISTRNDISQKNAQAKENPKNVRVEEMDRVLVSEKILGVDEVDISITKREYGFEVKLDGVLSLARSYQVSKVKYGEIEEYGTADAGRDRVVDAFYPAYILISPLSILYGHNPVEEITKWGSDNNGGAQVTSRERVELDRNQEVIEVVEQKRLPVADTSISIAFKGEHAFALQSDQAGVIHVKKNALRDLGFSGYGELQLNGVFADISFTKQTSINLGQ